MLKTFPGQTRTQPAVCWLWDAGLQRIGCSRLREARERGVDSVAWCHGRVGS